MFEQYLLLLRKEALYIWRDKKTLVTSLVLSVFLTPALFWGISKLTQLSTEDSAAKQKVVAIVQPVSENGFVSYMQQQLTHQYTYRTTTLDWTSAEADLKKGDIQLLVGEKIENGVVVTTIENDPRSNVSTFASSEAQVLYQAFVQHRAGEKLAQSNLTLASIYDTELQVEKVKIEGSSNELLTFLIPYLLILGLVQGGMQHAIDSTSGEKERQTLATTLSLSASPSVVGIAKITNVILWSLGATLINIISIIVTFKYIPLTGGSDAAGFDISGLGWDKIGQLFLIAVPLSLLISTAMVALGLYARNTKEGFSYATPLLMASIFAAISTQFFDANTPLYFYAIPILGQIISIKQIIFGNLGMIPAVVVTVVTLVAFGLLFWLTTRLFRREEVLFRV